MEAKRLGLCQKSLFVVPNHLTEQWASEFLNLYSNAKLLVARRKDFETANRKKFCARIATGDYDAVIIGHSQFERIPLSFERQERIIQEQIDETLAAINELKAHAGENFSIKQMEKTRKTLETKLEKLRSNERKDDVITFEQLGVDRLFVDESHFYKNLFLTTKMRNVAGLSTSEAQKSSDMFGNCRYLDEITGGRGGVFATGTPVSNSMTELYTVMRYLQYSTLQQKKLTHFDCWASTFGETTTAIELAPEGTGYRARTRFAKFFNLPELMNMFKEVADIKTSDQLHLPVPEAKFETVVVQPSEHQQAMVVELSERAAAVHSGVVDPSVDNMLKITSDGRKLGLDQRLMNPLLPDDPNRKLNACVQNVLRIYEEGQSDRLTQLLFCDLSTPKNDGTFNVYEDIRAKLIQSGVPEEEIAFIHDADTEAKKKDLFAKVRTGQVRVLLGSTQKMGAGTNVQDRLVAVHHLDVGWRPADMIQRNGRIIRQGNRNKEVQVYQYVTEGTFDAYLYQTLENKQKFISQIMTSKSPVRSCDDIDEQALSYAEIKAGFNAAKKLKVTPALGAYMGCILLAPGFMQMVTDKTPFTIFGISVTMTNYSQTLLPAVVSVAFLALVYKQIEKVMPSSLSTIFTPFLTMLITTPVALLVLAPIGTIAGNLLGGGIVAFGNATGFLGVAVLGAIWELLVMTGMHMVVSMPFFILFFEQGYQSGAILGANCATWACFGVALGAFLRMKKKEDKSMSLGFFISGIIGGVTEPTLYGLCLQYKRCFIPLMLGGFLGGAYMGITNVCQYVLGSGTSFLSVIGFTGGTTANLVNGVIACVLSMVVATVATYFIGFSKEELKG